MADEQAVHDVIKHVEEQTQGLTQELLANKPKAAEALASDLPAAGGLAQGVGNVVGGVVHGAGDIVGGVASTGADAIGAVGNVADVVHSEINSFFSHLRKRLGV